MDIFQEVKSRVTIFDLIRILGIQGEKNNFIRSFRNPDQKTGSLSIDKTGAYFTDFSTGEKGDLIRFYQAFQSSRGRNLSNFESAKEIAELFNLRYESTDYKTTQIKSKAAGNPVKPAVNPPETWQNTQNKPPLKIDSILIEDLTARGIKDPDKVNKTLLAFHRRLRESVYFKMLRDNPLKPDHRDYLRGRKFVDQFITEKKYFSVNKETLSRLQETFKYYINPQTGINEALYIAGLIRPRENRIQDIFYPDPDQLLMIPYFDTVKGYLNNTPDYIRARNLTKGTEIKYKGLFNDCGELPANRFYNLYLFENLREFSPTVWIHEGEIDTDSHQQILSRPYNQNKAKENCIIGIPGVNNFPKDPVYLSNLFKGCQIKILFDNDSAGRKATEEITGLLKSLGLIVRAYSLPDGVNDINDFLRGFYE